MRNVKDSGNRWGLCFVAVFCCAALLLAGCGERRSKQQNELGDTYLGLGKLDQAAEAYQKAIDLNPENVSAILGQARCLRAEKKVDEALTAYKKVVELRPETDPAYVEAARMLAQLNRLDEAEQWAADYEKVTREHGVILRAQILRDSGRAQEAVTLLQGLRGDAPRSVQVRLSLASAHLAAKQADEAEKELKSILKELDPASLPARMALVEVYREQKRLGEIIEQFRTLSEQRPSDTGVKLALARSLLGAGEYEEAEAIAQPILEQTPESSWANFVVGACMVAREAYADAIPYLQTAAQALSDEKAVAELLATARSGGAKPAAPAQPAAAVDTPPATASAPAAADDSWRGLWTAARLRKLVLERKAFLEQDEPMLRETLTLASLFIGSMQLAEEMVKELPEDSPYRAYIAAVKARNLPDLMKVMEEWKETGEYPRILRENAHGFGLAYLGARGQALGVLSGCSRQWPQNSVALYNLANMYRMARMHEFMARVLQRLMMAQPHNMEARDHLFKSLFAAGDYEEAQVKAELSYGLFPEDPRSVLNLAQVYRAAGQTGATLQVIQSGLKALPGNASLTIALARTLLYVENTEAAQEALKSIEISEQLIAQAKMIGAFALAKQGKWAEANAACEAIPEAQRSASTRILQAAALLKEGRKEDVARVLNQKQTAELEDAQTLLASFGSPSDTFAKALAANNEARVLFAYGLACSLEGFYATAFEALQQADAAMPGTERLPQLMIGMLTQGKDIEDRESLAVAIADKASASAKVWLGLAHFYRASKSDDKELAALDKAIAADSSLSGPWNMRARLFERKGDSAKALEAYERLHKLIPDDPITCNNLAYNLLAHAGDLERAAALANKALEKWPGSPHVLHTLGLSELRQGKLDDAEKHLGVALQLRPGDPVLLLDFGQILIAKELVEDGKKHVQLALFYADQLGLDFDRRPEAEALLKEE